jgi:L-ribulokinase
MQIYADVTGRTWRVAASSQTPALGAAMFAAVAAGPAAGGYATIRDAASRMAHLRDETYEPMEADCRAYEALYREYVRLHDLFGRGLDPAMKTLKRLRLSAALPVGDDLVPLGTSSIDRDEIAHSLAGAVGGRQERG